MLGEIEREYAGNVKTRLSSTRIARCTFSEHLIRFQGLDLRNLTRRHGNLYEEEGVVLKVEQDRRQRCRALAPARVVLLHARVVSHPFDRDTSVGGRQIVRHPI